ncbi:MAG: choice-of-anchor B family protein [Calditrichia bacterium]
MRPLLFPVLIFCLVLGMFSTIGFSQGSANVTLLKQLDAYQGYNDCWGYTAPDGREYALLGVRNGTSIVDITDGPNSVEVAFIPSATSTWKDIKTYQNYAYTVTESSTDLQVIDLSNLPTSATLANTYSTGFSTNPHNIYIDEEAGILYGAEDFNFGQSIRMFSLADPVNPAPLHSFGSDCHDMFAQDGVLYVAEGVDGSIGIFDVSNTAVVPPLISRIPIPSPGYVHNVWVTEDNNYMMTTEETSGKTVKMWDISDPLNVALVDDYLGPNGLAHNAHIKGDYSYLSHYGSGLRIVNIADPTNIFEEEFYQTSDAWGAWPFFDSGKVLISDISGGLYVTFYPGAVVTPTGIGDDDEVLPSEFTVSSNYPNPFNPSTTIDYSLGTNSPVSLEIYNISGQKVKTLVSGNQAAGSYKAVWDGTDFSGESVASGAYIYRFTANDFQKTQKMMFIK